MKDYMDAAGVWIRHNYALVTAIVMCAVVMSWSMGCDSTVTSIVTPEKKVNRAELTVELKRETDKINRTLATKVAAISAQQQALNRELLAARDSAAGDANSLAMIAAVKLDDLTKQDRQKELVIDFGLNLIAAPTGLPSGAAATSAVVLLLGALIDNRRKDGIIAGQRMTATPTA